VKKINLEEFYRCIEEKIDEVYNMSKESERFLRFLELMSTDLKPLVEEEDDELEDAECICGKRKPFLIQTNSISSVLLCLNCKKPIEAYYC